MASLLSYKGKILTNKEGRTYTSSGIVKHVDSFPENPEENVIYETKEYSDIDVWVSTGIENDNFNLYIAISDMGIKPNILYYLVDELPQEPNISDMEYFSETYCYIQNDIAYLYCDVGYGFMWVDVATLLTQLLETEFTNQGYIDDLSKLVIMPLGVYVTYKKRIGIKPSEKCILLNYNNSYADYRAVFNKTIEKFYDDSIYELKDWAFAGCKILTEVNCPNVRVITYGALSDCHALEVARFANCSYIYSFAFNDSTIKHLYLGNSQIVTLESINAFSTSEITLHVQPHLIDSYKTATNWSELIAEGIIEIVGDYTDE